MNKDEGRKFGSGGGWVCSATRSGCQNGNLAYSPWKQLTWCLHYRDKDESELNHTHPHRRATGDSGTGSFDALAQR